MADPWYPPANEYFVPGSAQEEYPVRQGDVFEPGEVPESEVKGWIGFMLLHPSCEVQTGKSDRLHVARLHAVSELADQFSQTTVTYGLRERDDGSVVVAFANTFWVPPATNEGPLSEPLFADFRETGRLPREALAPELRVGAMTHEARVYLIRRKIYFDFRWLLSLDAVRDLERDRIGSDDRFAGPRPEWL